MARPRVKKPPTPDGKRLLDLALEMDGSIAAFARRAGAPEQTVRRYIFDRTKKRDLAVVDRLAAAGWPRALLVSS